MSLDRRTTLRTVMSAAVAFTLLVAIAGPSPAQQAADGTPRIAVIDVGRILEDSVAGTALVKEIEALATKKGDEGRPMAEKAKALQDQLKNGAMSLAPEKLEELQRDFQDTTKALKRFEDDANEEIDNLRKAKLQQIERRVLKVVNDVGTEFGYTMMFNKFQSGLVYAREEIDITDLILERFDAATAAETASGE